MVVDDEPVITAREWWICGIIVAWADWVQGG